jgi:hypothetical protein
MAGTVASGGALGALLFAATSNAGQLRPLLSLRPVGRAAALQGTVPVSCRAGKTSAFAEELTENEQDPKNEKIGGRCV